MKLVLFEDNQCDNMHPIGLFRPLYDLFSGAWTFMKLVQRLNVEPVTLVREHLCFEDDTKGIPKPTLDEPYLFLNASIEPDVKYVKKLEHILKSGDPFISTSGNRVAAALVPPGKKLPENLGSQNIRSSLLEMNLPLESKLFKTIDWPHEVVKSHLRIFESNLDELLSAGSYTEYAKDVYTGADVNISPRTDFNTSNGPVVIGGNVTILPFTCFEGPVNLGDNTKIIEHSSIKDKTSIEYGCKVGGEVEASVIEPHSNKQHHGFLGHSWIGRWVNLGAGTTTSDLKNTYGKVRVVYKGKPADTDMQFLGSIIGDFSKTAVNTSLFTGKIIGTCSMIYGMVTTNVPSFSNYARTFGQITETKLEQIIKTQKRTFERRNITQTDRDKELLRRVYEKTQNERYISVEQLQL